MHFAPFDRDSSRQREFEKGEYVPALMPFLRRALGASRKVVMPAKAGIHFSASSFDSKGFPRGGNGISR